MKLLLVSCIGIVIVLAALSVEADEEVYVCPSGTEWWEVYEQRVKVRNPKWGRTNVHLYHREIFWNPSISRDMVRLIDLYDSHASARGGWLNVFTNTNTYKVLKNSPFTIHKMESGAMKANERRIHGNLQLGQHVHEDGDIKYEYTTRVAGRCP